jgi:hypothetical protein
MGPPELEPGAKGLYRADDSSLAAPFFGLPRWTEAGTRIFKLWISASIVWIVIIDVIVSIVLMMSVLIVVPVVYFFARAHLFRLFFCVDCSSNRTTESSADNCAITPADFIANCRTGGTADTATYCGIHGRTVCISFNNHQCKNKNEVTYIHGYLPLNV